MINDPELRKIVMARKKFFYRMNRRKGNAFQTDHEKLFVSKFLYHFVANSFLVKSLKIKSKLNLPSNIVNRSLNDKSQNSVK